MQRIKQFLILAFFLFSFIKITAANPNAPFNLRSFDKQNPIGTNDKPYFGWYLSDADANEIQSAYQIIVSSSLANLKANKGDVWDSNKTSSRKQNYIYLEKTALKATTAYYWKVRCWDKDGNVSSFSNPANFTTGLLTNKDWATSQWIKRDSKDNDDFTYFRKKANLPNKTIKKAIVYLSACHSYELYVNGQFVGKGFNNHYPQYSYYNAWDVTALLNKNAENLLACLTHWYGGGQGRATGSRGMILKTIIEYSDGTQSIIGSDKSWKQTQATQWLLGQPQRNGEGVGRVESVDSRKNIANWNTVKLDDSNWKNASEIGSHPTTPWTGTLQSDLTRVIEKEIKPKAIQNLGNGKYVIDLGKIYAGSFKITFKERFPGDTIKMSGGFVLNDDGTISTKFNQSTNLSFKYIPNGNNSVFNPNVYFGMRYLQVDNAPNELNQNNVSFISRHFELDPSRSSFETSNEMLNKTWELMAHTLILGAQEDFVDTPTREKGAFLLDSWSQAVPCMSVMYDRTMNMRALNEFLESQDQYWPDGRLNAVYPNVDGGRDIPDFTQAYLVWVWDYYTQTANVDFLKSNYSRLKKIADYVDTYKNDSTGLIHQLKGGKGPYEFGIIDWPATMRYGYDMTADSRTVIDAYAYEDFNILSKIAEVIGNSDDKTLYANKAEAIKKAINAHLINKDGVYIDGVNKDLNVSTHVSQHANILPYALNIVPEANKKQVIEEIKKQKMNIGMVCLRWLPESLGLADEGNHLVDLYTNPEWEGWAKTITQGGTATWESWDANTTGQSMSHPWGAVGLLAMQNYILGIKAVTPQHEKIQIKPLWFGDKLTHAKGTYPTDKGDIKVDWNYTNNKYHLKITVPNNSTAKVYLPKCDKTGTTIKFDNKEVVATEEGNYLYLDNIGSGEHHFER
nr:family 78 glycoside hydrolase catalytic domain [uncultured Flavobacterium sp.]